MEPMLQRLLAMQSADLSLVQLQAKGLDAFGRLFGARPDLAAPAVGRCAPTPAGSTLVHAGTPGGVPLLVTDANSLRRVAIPRRCCLQGV